MKTGIVAALGSFRKQAIPVCCAAAIGFVLQEEAALRLGVDLIGFVLYGQMGLFRKKRWTSVVCDLSFGT
jgi:maltodextrin utilization protein YvdJ